MSVGFILRISALLLVLFPFLLFAAEVRGRVVRVADGDAITILDVANAQHTIRFHGIDAPESHQAFGQKSKQHLSDYVAGKDVIVRKSKDKYGHEPCCALGFQQPKEED